MAPESTLTAKRLSRGSVAYIRLFGKIDETFVVSRIFGEVSCRDIIINLKAVDRVSSIGVRQWVNAMKELNARVDRISLVQCSPAIVSQLNMISNFSVGAAIVSVQVPFYCEKCGWDTDATHELGSNLVDGTVEPQPMSCKSCSSPMVMDDDPSTYFDFASERSLAAPSAEVLEFMRDFEAAMEDGSEDEVKSVDNAAEEIRREAAAPAVGEAAPEQESQTKLPILQKLLRTPMGPIRIGLGVAGVVLAAVALIALVSVLAPTEPPVASSAPAAESPPDTLSLDRLLVTHRFQEALALLDQMEAARSILPDAAARYRVEIDRARTTTAMNLRRKAQDSLSLKKYADAVEAGKRAESLEPLDGSTILALAEALRLSGDLTEAIHYYEAFAREFPQDPRVDAALYWRAEHLALTGKRTEARALFNRVGYKTKRSSYKRSARRRLRELK